MIDNSPRHVLSLNEKNINNTIKILKKFLFGLLCPQLYSYLSSLGLITFYQLLSYLYFPAFSGNMNPFAIR